MKVDTVVFDLDGTLLDTLEDLTDSVNYILYKYKYPKRTISEVRSFVGNGLRLLLERALPNKVSTKEFDKMLTEFYDYYGKHCAEKTKLYPGIEQMIHTLNSTGIKMAVVSNKGDFAVKDLCEKYLHGIITLAIGETPSIKRKPAPDMLLYALKELGSDLKSSVFVGDSEVDILTSQNAGLTCLSVTWGFRTKEFLAENGATAFMEKPEEILTFLQQQ